MSRQLKLKNKYKKTLAGLFFLFLGFLCLPVLQFEAPYATVLSDRKHQLLGAHIAADEQWRFPPGDSVPLLYREAVLLFEDRHFYRHPGINPVALLRAAWWNWKHGRVVSGGSTISMQVVRLARPASRTLPNKLWEMLLALRLEAALSKDSILALYAAHAPYGGNTVGLEAASWRYFRHDPGHLTPAETALLAVLPNAPSLLHLAKGRDELLEKRNRLLLRLYENQALDEQEYFLALDRKSTRLNSSHVRISYAVFCLKKKRTESVQYINTDDSTLHHSVFPQNRAAFYGHTKNVPEIARQK